MRLSIEDNVRHLYVKALEKFAEFKVRPEDAKHRIYAEIADLTGYFWECYEKRGSTFAIYMYESYLRLEDELDTLYGDGFAYRMLLMKDSNAAKGFSRM